MCGVNEVFISADIIYSICTIYNSTRVQNLRFLQVFFPGKGSRFWWEFPGKSSLTKIKWELFPPCRRLGCTRCRCTTTWLLGWWSALPWRFSTRLSAACIQTSDGRYSRSCSRPAPPRPIRTALLCPSYPPPPRHPPPPPPPPPRSHSPPPRRPPPLLPGRLPPSLCGTSTSPHEVHLSSHVTVVTGKCAECGGRT